MPNFVTGDVVTDLETTDSSNNKCKEEAYDNVNKQQGNDEEQNETETDMPSE